MMRLRSHWSAGSGLSGRYVLAALTTNGRGDATLAISDDAAGAEPAVAQRVFEPFFTTKGPGKGTGLGLSLAKEVVEDSGGQITFESTPGLVHYGAHRSPRDAWKMSDGGTAIVHGRAPAETRRDAHCWRGGEKAQRR